MNKVLTPGRFDDTVGKKANSIIWTAKAIGDRIDRSESWVRKVLATAAGTPVQQTPSGRLFVDEGELMAYFRHGEPHMPAPDRV
jgi:hypothetical protein